MLLVGSKAHPDLFDRSFDSDTDFIATWEEFELCTQDIRNSSGRSCYPVSGGKTWVTRYEPSYSTDIETTEYEIAWPGSLAEELLIKVDGISDLAGYPHVQESHASLDVSYTLKMSHRYLRNSPHFYKTMADIRILRNAGGVIFDQDWYKRRMKETYHYEHPNLDRSKDQFFGADAERYAYEHDDLHVAVSVTGTPAYESYKVPGKDVLTSRKLFDALPIGIRLAGVYEESCVLALERSVIPFGTDPEKAFRFALMKVCSSITSGWFRLFAWENHAEVIGFANSLGFGYYLRNVKDLTPINPGARNTML